MTAGRQGQRAALLYTRESCPLCFALRRLAQRSARGHGMRLVVVDVDSDAALRSRFGDEVPVLELPGGVSIRGRAAAGTVDEAFRQAAIRLRSVPAGSAGHQRGHVPARHGGLAWIRRALGLDPGARRT